MGCVNGNAEPVVLQVPPVPEWDGKAFSTMAVPVEIEMQGGFMNVSMSREVGAMNIVEEGYKLSAVFLPVYHHGKKKGQPLEAYVKNVGVFVVPALYIFQANPHEPAVPVETIFLQSGKHSVDGRHEIYVPLRQASAQGFPLSCIMYEPNSCMNIAPSSNGTTMRLVCQRHQGHACSKEYLIVDCFINFSAKTGRVSVDLSKFTQTLQTYASQGYKVASTFNPPLSANMEPSSGNACHIVFEKTEFSYCIKVVDVQYTAGIVIGSASANHKQFMGTIQQYSAQGWELAGLFDMPNELGVMHSTIRLIFQASTLIRAELGQFQINPQGTENCQMQV